MARHFRIYGHRGSPKRFPENTMASFEECLRAGADGFETDLRMLSDRTAVLYHDDDRDDVEIESLSFDDCHARGAIIDRASDLARFAGRTTMILEVKRSKWEETLLETIGAWQDIVVASFDHSVVTAIHERNAAIPVGITFHGYLLDVGEYAARAGATWCFPNYRFVDDAMVASLHAHGVAVVPWTANREHEWARLRDLGCDGVITDLPAEAVAWRDGAR